MAPLVLLFFQEAPVAAVHLKGKRDACIRLVSGGDGLTAEQACWAQETPTITRRTWQDVGFKDMLGPVRGLAASGSSNPCIVPCSCKPSSPLQLMTSL
jgi:hypothetical protein